MVAIPFLPYIAFTFVGWWSVFQISLLKDITES